MFKIIKYIINTCLIVLANIFLYLLIEDMSYMSYLVTEAVKYLLYERSVQFAVVIVILFYDIVFILSYLEIIWKKRKNIKIKTNNGKIEVSLNTIEDIAKGFLENQSIIKSVKTKVNASMFGAILNVSIENYKTDSLNEKLSNIKLDLEKHIQEMLGFKLKKINFNIAKINPELAVDEIKFDNTTEVVDIEESEVNLD